ncbi:MAG: helix-turn-helix domain-containing protein [Legionellales bacterium]|nr:helix-turn-helix domain-containing protein [Legionellales bacterium]
MAKLIPIHSKINAENNERHLSENLKKLLRVHQLSERELSRKTGLKQAVINRLVKGENQNPTLATLKPITEFFNISLSQLIGEEALHFSLSQQHAEKIENKIPLLRWDELSHSSIKNSSITTSRFITVTKHYDNDILAILVTNNKMEPLFRFDSTLIVKPSSVLNENTHFVLVSVGNHIEIRQLLYSGGKKQLFPLIGLADKMSETHENLTVLGIIMGIIQEKVIIEPKFGS